MTFNSQKFHHLRFGPPIEGYEQYYSPDGSPINICNTVVDLGVIMCDSANFDDHIQMVVNKGMQMVGWTFRVFKTRDQTAMLTIFKSLILPYVEYCCQLWSPGRIGQIRKIESVQRSFTRKLQGMQGLSYWDRLRSLNLYSLERRRDRYFIIYVWKILNNLAPNIQVENCRIQVYVIVQGGVCFVNCQY